MDNIHTVYLGRSTIRKIFYSLFCIWTIMFIGSLRTAYVELGLKFRGQTQCFLLDSSYKTSFSKWWQHFHLHSLYIYIYIYIYLRWGAADKSATSWTQSRYLVYNHQLFWPLTAGATWLIQSSCTVQTHRSYLADSEQLYRANPPQLPGWFRAAVPCIPTAATWLTP